jgi:uncharacterized protein (TIGR02598 family)
MKHRAAPCHSGATLVEVVVTVGILVSTLLPLVGMLSIAMDTSGKASNNTVGARIAAEVVGELQQANWDDLDGWQGREYYYDYQGVRLTGTNAQAQSAYTARAYLAPAGLVLAATGGPPANPWQRKVVALVVPKSANLAKAPLDTAESALVSNSPLPSQVMVHRALLVNLQKAP